MKEKSLGYILDTIKRKSFPNLDQIYSLEVTHMLSEIEARVIYICENDFFYFENGNLLFQTKCVTGANGFGVEKGSFKTPIGLHYISDMIGDNSHKYQKFIRRVPTEIMTPVDYLESNPGVYTRILRLQGVEENNKNTLSRGIYIHGNIHDWYWDIGVLKKSKGCIGLKVDEMVELFNMIKHYKKRVFVYIEEK